MRFTMAALLLALVAAPAWSQTPSIKEDFKDAGRSIGDASKHTYEKAKEGTMKGVGKVLEKTGEGFDKAAQGLDHAGEKVKDEAE